MDEVWETKDGRRRVRRDPPTLDEAVAAAQGLTESVKEQVEIVVSLMQVPPEVATTAVRRLSQRKDVQRVTVAGRVGAARAVVVERRAPRVAALARRGNGR
jgi:hypothetical protein